MRIHRFLSMAVALLLPFGVVAAFAGDSDPVTTVATASPALGVEPAVSSDTEAAWLVTHAERVRIEQAAMAARVEAETARVAAEARAAAEAARLAEVANRPKPTVTTIARRYTATTVASTPAEGARTAGSLPPKYVSDCESGGNPRAVNPNGHYGKWQFSQGTWEMVGGTGRPDHASEAEQDYRASILWDDGAGASHWECF